LRHLLAAVERQMLHARRLSFSHPVTGESVSLAAEPPADFLDLLRALRSLGRETD